MEAPTGIAGTGPERVAKVIKNLWKGRRWRRRSLKRDDGLSNLWVGCVDQLGHPRLVRDVRPIEESASPMKELRDSLRSKLPVQFHLGSTMRGRWLGCRANREARVGFQTTTG